MSGTLEAGEAMTVDREGDSIIQGAYLLCNVFVSLCIQVCLTTSGCVCGWMCAMSRWDSCIVRELCSIRQK